MESLVVHLGSLNIIHPLCDDIVLRLELFYNAGTCDVYAELPGGMHYNLGIKIGDIKDVKRWMKGFSCYFSKLNSPCKIKAVPVYWKIGEALSALRAQAEREKQDQNGCEWCNSLRKLESGSKPGDMIAIPGVRYTRDGDGKIGTMKEMYCPMCGRRLREEKTEGGYDGAADCTWWEIHLCKRMHHALRGRGAQGCEPG